MDSSIQKIPPYVGAGLDTLFAESINGPGPI